MNPSWLPSRCRWCSDVAVSESKSMSPSKTHHEIDIFIEFLQKSTGFTIENQYPLIRSPAWTLWTPCHQIHPFWSGRSRMVFGHNLQHMAPFGLSTTGFCMVFHYGTLVFSGPEAIFGVQDLDLGSGWAGHLSQQNRNYCVQEMVPHEG